MNADAVVIEYLCDQAVDSLPVLVAPPILHGWFPAFREFPGTEVSEPEVIQGYVCEVAASLVAHGARRITFLNRASPGPPGSPSPSRPESFAPPREHRLWSSPGTTWKARKCRSS